MNEHMWKALNAEQHAQIAFAMTGYELTAGTPMRGTLNGTLTLNGQAKPISFPVEFAAAGSALRVQGSYALKMSDWGVGSLQELDHVPIVAPITKHAATLDTPDAVAPGLDAALFEASSPHRGPTFVDVPLDAWGATSSTTVARERSVAALPDVGAVALLVNGARRPVLMVGGDVYWAGAEAEVLTFAEAARIPVFANDMGRGVIPADHELAFSRARSVAFKEADLMIVAGTPLDFRLGFGSFDAPVVHLVDSADGIASHVGLEASVAGDLTAMFAQLAEQAGRTDDGWIAKLRDEEQAKRANEQERLTSDATPIDPARVYGELRDRLDRDAVVIGDGGDFVSYMGKYVDTYTPGCFLGPGPYGCLGSGTGYALAAALAHPDRQVVVCYGDGAIGFTLGDLDTLVRHEVNVTAVIGNNGIWGLEKHPMQMIFGYDVVAELRPGTRYDRVAEALGGHGELVEAPGDIGPALDRAFAHDGLSVVNVLTDPADAYPRSSNLG
jgi:acetolactate synthase-1/2/3 large subunit